MDTTLWQALPARSRNRVGNCSPFGKAMGLLRRDGNRCLPSSNPTELPTLSFVPTLLKTTKDSS